MSDSDQNVLLTTRDLQKLADDCARMTSEIAEIDAKRAEIEAKRSDLVARYEQVRSLLDLLGIGHKVPPLPLFRVDVGIPITRQERSPWIHEIKRIVAAADGRISTVDLKAEVLKGSLAERFKESDKGYYHSIARLLKKGELIKHNSWLFQPDSYELFKNETQLVGKDDFTLVRTLAPRVSPMAEAIREIVEKSGDLGIPPGRILEKLKSREEFAAQVEKNNSSAYNVIARMVTRKQIIKRGAHYFAPDSKGAPMPWEISTENAND